MDKERKTLKILIYGTWDVGKTTLQMNMADAMLNTYLASQTGVDIKAKNFYLDRKPFRVKLWDIQTGGQFDLTESTCDGTSGILLVYDLTKSVSFKTVPTKLENLKKMFPQKLPITYLVGNKSDLEANRQVNFQEGLKFAGQNNLKFDEVSALKRNDVKSLLEKLIWDIVSNEENEVSKQKVSEETSKPKVNESNKCSFM